MRYEDMSCKHAGRDIFDRWDAQASVGSAIQRSAGSVKAGLGHSVVLRMELERDGVSGRSALNKNMSAQRWIYNDCLVDSRCKVDHREGLQYHC